MSRILVLDDAPGIVRLVALELKLAGFEVMTATSGEDAIRIAAAKLPDLAVLDLNLPGMGGLEVMSQLRSMGNVPVILLTGLDSEADRVTGLNQGADDYVVKPFSPEELSARVTAVLRRRVESETTTLRCGEIEVDLKRRTVRRRGSLIELTRSEWLLIRELAGAADTIVRADRLLARIARDGVQKDSQDLRVWVSRLRKKLEASPSSPRIIQTAPGIGYMLVTDHSPL